MAGEIITAAHASQAGHWYDAKTGNPAYTIIAKSGDERPTTLRDARKLGLVPSVTTIIREGAKPSLDAWKQQQVLMAALTLPRVDGESEEAWIARIIADSKEQAIKAAERGTLIHAYIQQGFEGKPLPEEGELYFEAATDELLRNGYGFSGGYWECETTFARDGYGGKTDLWQRAKIIVDAKSTDKPLDGLKTWDDQHMQVALYRRGLKDPTAAGGILYVSTKDVAAKLIMIPEPQLQRGEKMGLALLQFWYAKTGLARA